MKFAGLNEENTNWKGEGASLVAKHTWIKNRYGFPDTCEHCGLISDNHQVIHWANKTGKYLRDIDDWLRLCASCHKKYDMTPELKAKLKEIGTRPKPAKRKPILQLSRDGSIVKNWQSINEACEFTGILGSSISNNLKKRSKTAGGFIWVYN